LSSATISTTELRAREKLYAPNRHDRLAATLTGSCALVLLAASAFREERFLSPEGGLGYGLGILGLGAAVTLLSYSVRKRWMGNQGGPLRRWFRLHLALGILAPTAILLHSNFQLGSLNSSVALASMLAVAASGFIGRFVYSRIHRSLFGRRRDLREIRQDAAEAWRRVRGPIREDPEMVSALVDFGRWAADPTLRLLPSAARFATVGWRARQLERAARRALGSSELSGWPLDESVADYLWAATRVARFRGYERVFALWHAIHVPLCVVMFGAAAVHVVAVHLY
jgi:hypothetical protein